ncbi:PREDICTED: putative GATA transcription factor 22 [Erythranthe guttata]|uniref:putative GATA transcription factor 22 n=1 Tax=Erythranthe guttata TaxID=4155 RepID=UPI00064DA887|nr:PREDICTED: putative GATA transcription factor 22 [Erythranthe guttata]|eukprot:XP_012835595.1 PREDICTED: putative GATA transcription factor 22 [Erythranthe guttata]
MEGGNGNQAVNDNQAVNVDLTLRLGVANVDDNALNNNQVNRAPPARRRRGEQEEAKVCDECRTDNTPLWRKGPNGPQTLCNACGLRHARALRRNAEQN